MEDNDKQRPNASDSTRERPTGTSKMTLRRDLQEKKHFEQRISTEFGIEIQASDGQKEKAPTSIRQTFDGLSKTTS
jgi:hypothetical protein